MNKCNLFDLVRITNILRKVCSQKLYLKASIAAEPKHEVMSLNSSTRCFDQSSH